MVDAKVEAFDSRVPCWYVTVEIVIPLGATIMLIM